MAERIEPALARQLDSFTVPPLPGGFADRVLARAMAGAETVTAPLPRLRSAPPRRRWLRAGGFGLGVIAAGMISISAAAAGFFGQPISDVVHRTPVIGAAISHVIPERPRKRLAARKPPAPSVRTVPVAVAAVPESAPAPVTDAAPPSPEARAAWLAAHPKAARRIERRRALRRMDAGHVRQTAPVRAERVERRRARLRLRQRQRLDAARYGETLNAPGAAPITTPRAGRLERIRELRRQRREARIAPAQGEPLP